MLTESRSGVQPERTLEQLSYTYTDREGNAAGYEYFRNYWTRSVTGEYGENLASDFAARGIVKVWYRSNLTGSSLYAVDAGYTVVAHAVYDPWGAPRSSTYTDANFSGLEGMLSYTGYSWDVTLELYYAQARMYTAADKRFTTQDPAKDGANWYAYCGNNPLTNVDVYGLEVIIGSTLIDSVRIDGKDTVTSVLKNRKIPQANQRRLSRKA
jgi:RHS repeat-associated protein